MCCTMPREGSTAAPFTLQSWSDMDECARHLDNKKKWRGDQFKIEEREEELQWNLTGPQTSKSSLGVRKQSKAIANSGGLCCSFATFLHTSTP